MILSRTLSFVFRTAEFICAVILVGLGGGFIYRLDHSGAGPRGRLIFTEVWAVLSTILSFVWIVPFTWSFMHYPIDFLISIGWFASFGILYQWVSNKSIRCSGIFGAWNWDGNSHDGYCHRWRAMEAFAFMSAIFWLISAMLSIHVFHRVRGKGSRGPVIVA